MAEKKNWLHLTGEFNHPGAKSSIFFYIIHFGARDYLIPTK
jgi:hypothetical protein